MIIFLVGADRVKGKIGLQDLANIKTLGPLAQFGRVADGVAILQGVDLTEVVGNAPVNGKSNISIPAGGGLKRPGALGQTLQTSFS